MVGVIDPMFRDIFNSFTISYLTSRTTVPVVEMRTLCRDFVALTHLKIREVVLFCSEPRNGAVLIHLYDMS